MPDLRSSPDSRSISNTANLRMRDWVRVTTIYPPDGNKRQVYHLGPRLGWVRVFQNKSHYLSTKSITCGGTNKPQQWSLTLGHYSAKLRLTREEERRVIHIPNVPGKNRRQGDRQ